MFEYGKCEGQKSVFYFIVSQKLLIRYNYQRQLSGCQENTCYHGIRCSNPLHSRKNGQPIVGHIYTIILIKSVCLSVGVRKLQVAILLDRLGKCL